MILTEKHQDLLESTKYAPLSESEKGIVAQLLENQEAESAKLMNESTLSGDIAQFTPILVPIVRRVMPSLMGNNLVGVQALNMPTGYLYAMVSRYTNNSLSPITPTNKAQILVVASASAFTVGGDVTAASGATGVVEYIEGLNILVKLTSTIKFAAGDAIDNANPWAAGETTVTGVYSNEARFLKVLKNYSGPYATSAAEALGKDMKELGFDIARTTAEAKSRKLKGKYTVEMFQDLKSMHGLDAESELMDMMSTELQLEIDREIVTRVNDIAVSTADVVVDSFDGRWAIEKMRSLGIKISNEAREIGRLTRRGAGNTIIVSPKTAVALEQIGSFVLAPSGKQVDASGSGITSSVMGTYDNRFKVAVDNFADKDYATVLYKGASNKDAGLFFAPYVGLSFTKVVDPDSGQPAVILNTRYDIVANPLNPEFYFRSFDVDFTGTVLA